MFVQYVHRDRTDYYYKGQGAQHAHLVSLTHLPSSEAGTQGTAPLMGALVTSPNGGKPNIPLAPYVPQAPGVRRAIGDP